MRKKQIHGAGPSNNPRIFRKVRYIANKDENENIPIPLSQMSQHFTSLNDGPPPQTRIGAKPGFEANVMTDSQITTVEVENAIIRWLKKNKAAGLDGLSPTVFKLFDPTLIKFLTTLFNKVLLSGVYPDFLV